MRVLLQQVSAASVAIEGRIAGQIGKGYLLFLGVMKGDSEEQARSLAEKITKLRLFSGDDGKINDRSLVDVGGEVLVVSQFTLAADLTKGNRPDYTAAAVPAEAEKLYRHFVEHFRSLGVAKVETGTFGALMDVSLTNDGPVTLFLEK